MKGNSLLETRRKNRILIKREVFRSRNAIRPEIARELGLTMATISTSVNEMLRDGILEEVFLEENDSGGAGRRPMTLRFRETAACAIGIEMAPFATRGVLVNVRGEVLCALEKPVMKPEYERALKLLTELVKELLAVPHENLCGIGIGLAGVVNSKNHRISSYPVKSWNGKDLAGDLQKILQIPVRINNNIFLRAYGYQMMHNSPEIRAQAYFFLSRGIACPLIMQDEIVSGTAFGAGELGQTILCADGDMKRANDLASEYHIFERMQEEMLAGRCLGLQKRLRENGRLTMKEILECQEAGDPEVSAIMEETVAYAGIILSNVVNMIAPDRILVDGYIFQNARNREVLQQVCRRYVYAEDAEYEVYFLDKDFSRGAVSAAMYMIDIRFLRVWHIDTADSSCIE